MEGRPREGAGGLLQKGTLPGRVATCVHMGQVDAQARSQLCLVYQVCTRASFQCCAATGGACARVQIGSHRGISKLGCC